VKVSSTFRVLHPIKMEKAHHNLSHAGMFKLRENDSKATVSFRSSLLMRSTGTIENALLKLLFQQSTLGILWNMLPCHHCAALGMRDFILEKNQSQSDLALSHQKFEILSDSD